MKRAGTAMILISALAAAGLWLTPDAPTRPGASAPTPAWTLDPRDAPHLLERFIDRHEKPAGDGSGPRFEREQQWSVTEARLLALALPETVEPLLERIAGDPARSDRTRDFAARILGFLPDADAALVRLAPRSASARRELCARDFRGDHLSIYLAAGDAEALSHWTDPAAVSALKRLAALSDEGRRMEERTDILLTPGWAVRLSTILGDACHEQNYLTPWALQVARSRALPGLASTLRDRLDTAIVDDYRDDVLLALSELDGELTDDEQARLEAFGYLGDPAAHLARILGRN
jgi:hypothetical protein